jgi:hypothetical protein
MKSTKSAQGWVNFRLSVNHLPHENGASHPPQNPPKQRWIVKVGGRLLEVRRILERGKDFKDTIHDNEYAPIGNGNY